MVWEHEPVFASPHETENMCNFVVMFDNIILKIQYEKHMRQCYMYKQ